MSALSRLARLKAMPATEIAGRVQALAHDTIEKALKRPGLAEQPDALRRKLSAKLRHAPAWKAALLAERRRRNRPCLISPAERDAISRMVPRDYRDGWMETCREADGVHRHSFMFFGDTFDLGSRIDWHADPRSKRRWPEAWHSEIDIFPADGPGDIKDVWELSRHQFLIDLGKRFWVEGRADDADKVVAIVKDWVAHNRYGHGVNWANALEPAYRALSWLWAYEFCLDADGLDEEAHALWVASFHDHARFLYHHLELYASPYNHLIGEAAVLYMLGLAFPELTDASAWCRRGRDILESRLGEQFYGDGGSVEQATLYHHATLGFYLLAALFGRGTRHELSPAVWRAVEQGIEYSMSLVQPDGCVPMIGDSDDARPIRFDHHRPWDFRAFQAIGAVLFDRPDFKYVAQTFHEDALWLLGVDGRDRFAKLRSEAPREASIALRESGYFVLRSDWSENADYACVDCGEQAGGLRRDEVPSAAHGHADCLSLTLFLGGRPVLVDSGFYTYNGDVAWERHFRETAAHNTARIDGEDQARHLEKMAWCHVPQAQLEQWQADGEQALMVGSHDGYQRGPGGVRHRRTAWMRPGGYLLLYDEFIASDEGDHHVELNFQLHPDAVAQVEGTSLVADGDFEICWVGSQPLSPTLYGGGGTEVESGWIAPGLGVRQPAPRLSLSATLRRRHEVFLTVVADRQASRVLGITTDASRTGDQTLRVVVDAPDFADHIVATTGVPSAIGPFETDSPLAIWRVAEHRIVEKARSGGSFMRRRGGEDISHPSHPPSRKSYVRHMRLRVSR